MGDSGSLSIGLIIAFLAIKVTNLPLDSMGTINPVFPMIVLAYPAIDTLRVFFIRLSNGLSPFSADRKHIHHNLLDLGLSHGESTMTIVGISILFSLIAYQLRLSPNLSFFILVPIILFVSHIPHILIIKRNK
jgi:UDP-N-acetylmuramyl pentapeptide phosphotransferase/UDP-N-acetylglucosamine-1-phosphate transferase